ncbi:MAG TPA: hypothetical protein VMD91_07150 [Candidatus Sulfotelmatobacter sp.]|nr:hypothetical protein [Candidatus Sulfotelmatobacter sp.]
MRGAALALTPLLLVGCVLAVRAQPTAWPTPLARSTPAPLPTQVWSGAPASSFTLTVEPLGVSPDGSARAVVRADLRDASDAPTRLRRGGDFDFSVDRGSVQWQTRLRYRGPAAVVAVRDAVAVTIRAHANEPAGLGSAHARFDARAIAPTVVAGAIGPHLVRVGWFPRVRRGVVRVYRVDERGIRASVPTAVVRAPASSWDDGTVRPGAVARYLVALPGGTHAAHALVPPELPRTDAQAVRGTATWLAFSGDPLDDERYAALDVAQIVDVAVRAHLRAVELRLAYGAFDETTPDAKPTVDALIDGLVTHGVRVIGWTVPRTLDADDLTEACAVAAYRTPAGNGISGLAVDLERGPEFLGTGASGYAALRDYLAVLRRAVGPHVLLLATVEDPYLDRLTAATFPYPAIARAADVLQPMVYWHAFGGGDPARARRAVAGSLRALRALAPGVPVDVGLQTAPLGPHGAPSPAELAAALSAAHAGGALGVAFYDWSGTAPAQWEVLARDAARGSGSGPGVRPVERQP